MTWDEPGGGEAHEVVSVGSAEAAGGGEAERCLVVEVPWGLRFFLNAGASILEVMAGGKEAFLAASLLLSFSRRLRMQARII